MMPRWTWLALALATTASPVMAEQPARVGAWVTYQEKDPFETGRTIIAVTAAGLDRLAVRCFSGRLSTILILPTHKREFEIAERVDYRYRADEGAVGRHTGEVFGDYNLELPNARDVLQDALKAKQLAFEVALPGGALKTITFRMKASDKALAGVRTNCGPSNVAVALPEGLPPRPEVRGPAPVAKADPAPTMPAALSADALDALERRAVSAIVEATAYASHCPGIEVSKTRMALLMVASGADDVNALVARVKTQSDTKLAQLEKDKSVNRCQEAWTRYGSEGTDVPRLVVRTPGG